VCREFKKLKTSVLGTGSVVRPSTIIGCLEDVEDDLRELKMKRWRRKQI
jgi:hypothetical protein